MTISATAFELATVDHWHDFEQLIPWAAIAVLTVATLLSVQPGGWARTATRLLVVLVLGAAIYGVIDHTIVNYESGPLDQRFADTWQSMPASQQWWYAVTKTVGPSPTLAPGILGLGATLLLLADILHAPAHNHSSDIAER